MNGLSWGGCQRRDGYASVLYDYLRFLYLKCVTMSLASISAETTCFETKGHMKNEKEVIEIEKQVIEIVQEAPMSHSMCLN